MIALTSSFFVGISKLALMPCRTVCPKPFTGGELRVMIAMLSRTSYKVVSLKPSNDLFQIYVCIKYG